MQVLAAGCITLLAIGPAQATSPTPLRWVYEAERMNGYDNIVDDPDASAGRARCGKAKQAEGPGGRPTAVAFGPYTAEQPAGRYRATFRLKVSDNTRDVPVCVIDATSLQPAGYVLAQRWLKATDFARPTRYQEFSIEYERTDAFVSEFRVHSSRVVDVWLDRVVCEQLQARPDKATPVSAPATLPKLTPRRVLLVVHPESVPMGLELAAREARATEVTVVPFAGWPGRKVLPADVLPTAASALDYDVIGLGGIYAGALGERRRQAIRDFVRAGGSLVMFGGPRGFGCGGYVGTFLDEILPVRVLPRRDLVSVGPEGPIVFVPRPYPLTAGLDLSDRPMVAVVHRVAGVKPGARVLLAVGRSAHPVVTLGRYGNGKVAALSFACGPAYTATLQRPDTMLWNWHEWQGLVRRLMTWLFRRSPPRRQ